MVEEQADWRTPQVAELLTAVLALPDRASAERFFRDLCTLRELHDLAQRWQVVRLLDAGRHYAEISRETGASTATVTRIAQWLHHGTGGYREALARMVGAPGVGDAGRPDRSSAGTRPSATEAAVRR